MGFKLASIFFGAHIICVSSEGGDEKSTST
jgi:hypothetical protein